MKACDCLWYILSDVSIFLFPYHRDSMSTEGMLRISLTTQLLSQRNPSTRPMEGQGFGIFPKQNESAEFCQGIDENSTELDENSTNRVLVVVSFESLEIWVDESRWVESRPRLPRCPLQASRARCLSSKKHFLRCIPHQAHDSQHCICPLDAVPATSFCSCCIHLDGQIGSWWCHQLLALWLLWSFARQENMANHLWWTKPPWRPDVPRECRAQSSVASRHWKDQEAVRLSRTSREDSETQRDAEDLRTNRRRAQAQKRPPKLSAPAIPSVQLRMLRPPGRPVRSATRLIATKGSHVAPLLWVDRDFFNQKTQRWFSRQRRPCDTSSHSASEPTHLPAHGYPGSKTPNMSPKGCPLQGCGLSPKPPNSPDLSIVSDPDIDTYRYSRIDVESMSDMSAARQNKTKQHGGTLVEGQASGEPPTWAYGSSSNRIMWNSTNIYENTNMHKRVCVCVRAWGI